MIDDDGFRANVGIILSDDSGRVFWARRVGQDAWQFPQGGIRFGESPEQALFRELQEEVGLTREHVDIMGVTADWLYYHLPKRYIRRHKTPVCIGQKQRWYMLRIKENAEQAVNFDLTDKPEFDGFKWVDYWHPLEEVVFFKRNVYKMALEELAPLVTPQAD